MPRSWIHERCGWMYWGNWNSSFHILSVGSVRRSSSISAVNYHLNILTLLNSIHYNFVSLADIGCYSGILKRFALGCQYPRWSRRPKKNLILHCSTHSDSNIRRDWMTVLVNTKKLKTSVSRISASVLASTNTDTTEAIGWYTGYKLPCLIQLPFVISAYFDFYFVIFA